MFRELGDFPSRDDSLLQLDHLPAASALVSLSLRGRDNSPRDFPAPKERRGYSGQSGAALGVLEGRKGYPLSTKLRRRPINGRPLFGRPTSPIVTVPISALHQGHGRADGRRGFRTPNRGFLRPSFIFGDLGHIRRPWAYSATFGRRRLFRLRLGAPRGTDSRNRHVFETAAYISKCLRSGAQVLIRERGPPPHHRARAAVCEWIP